MPIIDALLFVVKLLAALGCGLMAGLCLFCLRDEISRWPAIRRGGGRHAIDQCRDYQSDVSRGFFRNGGGMSSIMVVSLLRWHDPGATYLLVGSSLYLLGTFLVTLVFNVPNYRSRAAISATATEKIGRARYCCRFP
jgi:uncharacterized membrane protein